MLRNEFERRDHKIEIPSMSSRPDFAKLNAAIRNWTEKSAKLAGKTYSYKTITVMKDNEKNVVYKINISVKC